MRQKSGCSARKLSDTPSFSSGRIVQVEYTSVPPGLTYRAALSKIAPFPEDTFWPAHNKMLATLGGEGVAFDDQLIDRTFEADAAPTRKPRTGMFGRYTGGEYDLAASYVIGDRATDILLARNLGARGILLAPPAEGLRTLEKH